ncbi:hypothetical protein BC629DRAFT_1148825 [Irpex lacteus]|nr:hypothetical protein BC629DRAFT_1148825 [Irpex lacteus]
MSTNYSYMKSTPYTGTSNFKSVKLATGSLHLEAPFKKTTTDTTPKPTSETKQKQRTQHTHAEVWKWTLTQHAIAPCRVEDIYDLQECDSAKPGVDPDYFWLGNVPCRSVLIYGMVVGVQVYEQRVVYTIDDGTGKIDCNLREAKSQNTIAKGKGNDSPKKQHAPSASRSNPQASSSKAPPTLMTLPTPPVPIAAVGDIVRATGRVLQRRDARLINLDNLTICRNATEEPLHWLSVLNLHETWYNSPTTSPFVIPPPPLLSTTIASSSRRPSISEREGEQEDARGIRAMPPPLHPVSPSKSSVASSAPSSPSSVASSSVSGSSHHGPMSPPRLRHPSRLHTRDLTANTFRIYVKHYMDNAPPNPSARPRRPAGLGLVSDSSEDEDAWGDQGDPGTPTKPRRGGGSPYVVDLTPRPPRKMGSSDRTTPRVQSTKRANDSDGDEKEGEGEGGAGTGLRGYTLSHLRRVPELALLARRVVEAEYKRRAKEQRKKQKEEQASKSQHPSTSKSHSSSSSYSLSRSSYASTSSSHRHASGSTPTTARSTSVALGKGKEGEPIGAKMKRLFRYAVRQLYEEGSIVLWDGPVRPHPRRFTPIPRPSFTSSNVKAESESNVSSGRLWKMGSSASASVSIAGDSTMTSMSVGSASMAVTERSLLEDDLDELSDSPAQEEAYIPLTSPYLAKIIEQAISEIMSRSHSHSYSRSHGYGYVKKGPPPPGPTVDEIVRYLHRKDERWARVGEWAVKEALEWGRESGRVWCVGDGRWEVCG